jgi:hypothetical protein
MSNEHVIYLKRHDAFRLLCCLQERRARVDGKESLRYLLDAVARLDGFMARDGDRIEIRGPLGWLRIIAQVGGEWYVAEVERQLHQEVGG